MSSTVAVGAMEITSNHEAAKDMVAALKPEKDKPTEPKVLVDGGQESEEKPDPEALSKAASELGRKGGEAAAKAREAEAKKAEKVEAKEKPEEAEEEKPGRAKVRIEELARQRAEERRAREAAEKRAADLEARLARLEAQAGGDGSKADQAPKSGVTPHQGSAKGNGKPTPDAFDTYEEFVEALTDWKADQILERESTKARQMSEAEQHVSRLEAKVSEFNKRVAEAKTKDEAVLERVDPRFLDLTPTFMLPPGSQVGPANDVAQAIVESEHAVGLMVYLSEHPDQMEAILKLPDSYAVTRAIGRIEAKVAELPPPAPKGTSKAPPPVTPIAPNGQAGEPDLFDPSLDFDTFYKRAAGRRR